MNKSNHISKISTLYNLIDTITKLHKKTTAIWHDDQPKEPNITDTFMKNVILNHLMNFKLWHIEDIARRRNVDHETIANYKHEIDLYPEWLIYLATMHHLFQNRFINSFI